jgi:hypothetical protein
MSDSTATRETGKTADGEKTERATVADSAAEQRDDEPTEPEPEPVATVGSLQGEAEDGVATAAEQRQATVAALLRERAGYAAKVEGATEDLVRQKFSKRVAAVDAELKRHGAKPPKG